MRLFNGLPRSDYQDVLRALGHYLDERSYRNIRIIENDEGIIVQATPVVDGRVSNTYETFLMTEDGIRQLLVHAYERRAQRAGAPVSSNAPSGGTAETSIPEVAAFQQRRLTRLAALARSATADDATTT